jgi:hypothetical protein
MHERSNLREKRFILAFGFRGFNPICQRGWGGSEAHIMTAGKQRRMLAVFLFLTLLFHLGAQLNILCCPHSGRPCHFACCCVETTSQTQTEACVTNLNPVKLQSCKSHRHRNFRGKCRWKWMYYLAFIDPMKKFIWLFPYW